MRMNTARIATILCLLSSWQQTLFAKDPMPATDGPLGKRVASLFQVGYGRGPRAASDIQRAYESLRSSADGDPRIDYAHGLIQLKQLKQSEAQADFIAATKRPGKPYLPAWEALIWCHFVAKEFDEGLESLVKFARLVQESKELTDDVRRDEVYWIGRVMAAAELSLDSVQSRESWLQAETKLANLYNPAWIESYHGGKEDVHVRHGLIEDEIRQAREKSKVKQASAIEKKQDRLEKSLETARTKRDNLKKTAAEAKDDLEDQSASFDKQMQRLEKDYAFLERRGMSLLNSMLLLDQQISTPTQAFRNQPATVNNPQKMALYQNQRLVLETEFQRVAYLSQQVSTNAERLMQQRSEYLQQHQKATGELSQEAAVLEKWRDRTLKQASVLKKSEANLNAPFDPAKVQAVSSFRTYIELDLNAERDKVLQSFGVTADTKP